MKIMSSAAVLCDNAKSEPTVISLTYYLPITSLLAVNLCIITYQLYLLVWYGGQKR